MHDRKLRLLIVLTCNLFLGVSKKQILRRGETLPVGILLVKYTTLIHAKEVIQQQANTSNRSDALIN